MAEILSQAEIDALLNAMSSGELDADQMQQKDEKKVRNYDFSRLQNFPKSICGLWRLYLNTMPG